jgi:hypothetical protein
LEEIKGLLTITWNAISADYIYDYLRKRRADENISDSDICRVELRADEVRSAVYSHISLFEDSYADVVNAWYDLPIEVQDKILTETFPSTQMYGV